MAKRPDRIPTPPPAPTAPELPERWSVQRKQEVVLRLRRGEPLDQVSRATQVPAHELEAWQRRFLEAGQRGLVDTMRRMLYRKPMESHGVQAAGL